MLDAELRASLGETPSVTHLDSETLSPDELAKAVLGEGDWSSSTGRPTAPRAGDPRAIRTPGRTRGSGM